MQRAFTLIELSIVLIIIGLIVGGLLAARDLITAAAVRAQIDQIQGYNQALAVFQIRYNGLPGDLANGVALGVSTHDSDGDGVIDGQLGVATHPVSRVFSSLSTAGLLDNTYANGETPLAVIGKSGYVALVRETGTSPPHWWVIGHDGSTNAAVTNGNGMSPAQAYQIDAKLDDGLYSSGNVQTIIVGENIIDGTWAGNQTTCRSGASATVYDASSDTPRDCSVRILSLF